MKSKVTSSRITQLSGIVNNKIVTIPILVVRKNCIRRKSSHESKLVQSGKIEVLGVVSHPTLCRSKTFKYISAWCHPFRDDSMFKVPSLLLSESDFVDTAYIKYGNSTTKKWDYFYFTMGGIKNGRRKGFNLFMECLPELEKHGLRGILVNYSRDPLYFSSSVYKNTFRKCRNLKYVHRKLKPESVAEVMVSSRFGLFPNDQDCSPLLLSECLVRNIPVLINENILGGWKYINDNTGLFFNKDNISEKITNILSREFSPAKYFSDHYGFERTSKKLAEFGSEHLKSFKNCKMACFSGIRHLLERYL